MGKHKRAKLLLLSVQNIERLLEGLLGTGQGGNRIEFDLCPDSDTVHEDRPAMGTRPLGQRTEIDITEIDPTEELYTIRESYTYLVISRSTLGKLRDEGYLTDVRKGRTVRLILRELEELKLLYSIPKGKI